VRPECYDDRAARPTTAAIRVQVPICKSDTLISVRPPQQSRSI